MEVDVDDRAFCGTEWLAVRERPRSRLLNARGRRLMIIIKAGWHRQRPPWPLRLFDAKEATFLFGDEPLILPNSSFVRSPQSRPRPRARRGDSARRERNRPFSRRTVQHQKSANHRSLPPRGLESAVLPKEQVILPRFPQTPPNHQAHTFHLLHLSLRRSSFRSPTHQPRRPPLSCSHSLLDHACLCNPSPSLETG